MAREDLRLPETVSENRYNQRTSIHLGEILKFREDHHNPRNVSNSTLGSVLNLEIRSSPEIRSGRTLLDIIQADSTGESKKTWRYFREKLRLKRANAAWTSEMQRANSSNNNGNNSMNNRMMLAMRLPTSDPDIDSASSRTLSSLLLHKNLSSLLNEESTENNVVPEETDITPATTREEEEEEEEEGEGEGEGQVRMSLMALLAETDREMGIDSAYVMEEDEDDEDVVVEEDENDGGGNVESGDYCNCCVCMVRHKGSAFIPCGHTFCRLCSRELYVQRGNCPICNAFILEILDIF